MHAPGCLYWDGGGGGARSSTIGASQDLRAQPASPASLEQFAADLKDHLGELSGFLGDTSFDLLLRVIGQYGQAKNLRAYQSQFQLLPMTAGAGAVLDDVMFACLRVAGPNPVVLRRASTSEACLPSGGPHAPGGPPRYFASRTVSESASARRARACPWDRSASGNTSRGCWGGAPRASKSSPFESV